MSSAPPQPLALERGVQGLGERVLGAAEEIGELALLSGQTFRSMLRDGVRGQELLVQLEAAVVRSTFIVGVTALFTGMVLSLQTAFALGRFGARPYVGSIVGLAVVRELGPVLAALMVAARVGAGMTSELGSMKVTEQVDAIRAMGGDPVRKLVVPRMLATVLGLPLLTFIAIVLGVAGGMVVADLQYGIHPSFYMTTVTTTVTVGDFVSGVTKTFVFGWIVAMVACHVGLRTSGGTRGVGRATTRAVVVASIAIFVSDFFLTKLLMLVPDPRVLLDLFRDGA